MSFRITSLAASTAALGTLVALYAYTAWAALNPHASADYEAYYLTKKTSFFKPARYKRELAGGIELGKRGLPSYVRYLGGLYHYHKWGRWSDSRQSAGIYIEYFKAFYGKNCFSMIAAPSRNQAGKPAIVSLGSQTRSIRFNNAGFSIQKVDFDLTNPSTVATITPTSPGPLEWDRLYRKAWIPGIAIKRIIITPGKCSI